MTVYKCDRCGKIIYNWQISQRDYLVKKVGISSPDDNIDLCEECYASFVDWMEGTEIYLENKTAFKPPKREPGEIKAYRLDEPNPDLICEMEGDLTMEGEDGQEE